MSTKPHTHAPSRDGLYGCILLIALLISSIVVLILGSFATSGRKNPIENLMLAIRDGFETEADDIVDDGEDDWGDDWGDDFGDEDDKWGDNWGQTTEALTEAPIETTESTLTDPPTTTVCDTTAPIPDETDPSITDAASDVPSETDNGSTPSETQAPDTAPPVTQAPVTTPPVTTPPVTDPPVTKPPVTDPPVVDPDRVNDPDYFKDALFIGDSRTVGLATYGKITGATYFARTSMNVSNAFADKKSETEKSGLNLTDFLTKYKFKKIYVLLGINEIGYSYSWIMTRYEKLVNTIRELQPDAIIILQSNMHVTQKKSDANPDSFNNKRINELNKRIASLADNKTVFYADMTHVFDNASGALNPEYTGDGVHLKGKYYALWRDWLLEYGKR